MEKSVEGFLKNKIVLLILSEVDNHKSLSDIQKNLSITYKTLLFWIKEMEKRDLIVLKRIPRNNKSIVMLNPKYKDNEDIAAFKNHLLDIYEILNDKKEVENKKYLSEILNKLDQQGFLDQDSLIDWNNSNQRRRNRRY